MTKGKDELENASTPAPPLVKPVLEPAELKPTELADDVSPFDEDANSRVPEPTPPEPVIADLDAAKEVEPHAAELEVAPDPIGTVTVVGWLCYRVYSQLIGPCRPGKIVTIHPKCRPTLEHPWPSLTLPRPSSSRYERGFYHLIRLGCLPLFFNRTRGTSLLWLTLAPCSWLRNPWSGT